MNTMPMDCDRLFEALSATIDGEATPDEVRLVQAHLAGCAHCRETEAALRGLSTALVPVPALPTDFAARTRRLVEERASRTLWSRLEELARRFDALIPVARLVPVGAGPTESPLGALMQTRADRAGVRGPSFWLALAAGLYGLPALLLGLLGWAHSGTFFLMAVGLGLLGVLPLYHFRTDVSILTSLRRGRCLEEILGTGLPTSGVVDSLAVFSLRSLLRVGWPVALVMLCGTPLFESADRPSAAIAACLWLPALAVVFAVGSYAVQALVVFARGGDRPTVASIGAFLVLVAPAAVLGLLGAWGAVLAATWVGLAGRTLAIWGLDHSAQVERWNRPGSPRRNRWIRSWSDNPIVVREVTRLSAAVPLGVLGLFAVRFVPALLPGAAAWGLAETKPPEWSFVFWTGLAALGWILYLRAANRTSSALAQETEGSTLETMVQSGMSRAEFVSGWLQVACMPLYLELAVTAALVMGVAFTLPEALSGWADGPAGTLDLGAALLAVVALTSMPLAGAWAGLAVSTSSASRREAGGRAVTSVLRSVGLWLAGWGLLATGLTTASVVFSLQFDSDVWTSLVMAVLPTAGLGFALLGVTVVSRRTVRANLRDRWEGVPLPQAEAASATKRLHRSVLLAPALLAGGLATAQSGLFLSVLLTSAGGPAGPVAWLVASFTASAVVGLAAWWLLRPLAYAIADHCARTVGGAVALGAASGALAGSTVGTVPLVTRLLGIASFGSDFEAGTSVVWSVLAAALVAGLASALVWLARPPVPEAPRSFLSRLQAAGGPADRRGLALAGVVLVVGLGMVAFMVQQSLAVPVQDPRTASELMRAAEQREASRLAVSPEHDGFALLRPALMKSDVGLAKRYVEIQEGMKALSPLVVGDEAQVLEKFRAEPKDALRARTERLDAILPLVREALARPEFVMPPRWSEGLGGLVPNFILMRALSQSLWVRALAYEEEGRLDQALETHLLNLRWSQHTFGQGPLIHGMIAVAMTAIAEEALLDFLGRHRLSGPQYDLVREVVLSSPLTVSALEQHLDDEFAFGQRAFDDVASGSVADLDDMRALLFLPRPFVERERRVYTNAMLQQRELLHRSNRELAKFQVDERFWSQSPFSVAAILMPNMQRALCQMRMSLSRHAAVAAVCELELERLRTGHYPDLPPTAYSALDEGSFRYERVGDGYRLWSESVILERIGEDGTTHVWMPRGVK